MKLHGILRGYYFYQDETKTSDEKYIYYIYDNSNTKVKTLKSNVDLSSIMPGKKAQTKVYQAFMDYVNEVNPVKQSFKQLSLWDEEEDEFDYDEEDDSYSSYKYSPRYGSNYVYKEPETRTQFIEDNCKSDTLVFHMTDRTTEMLSMIYEGRGWDVVRETGLSKEEKKQLIERHHRIICLGHGSSYGLIGGNVTNTEAPYLKDKKLFIIWCNADAFFSRNGIGDGYFITGNMPSEVWECRAAGCGEISAKEMLDNITDWTRILRDHLDALLEGGATARAAVEKCRDEYIEKWGNHRVTIYNAERTKLQGDKQPDLSDRYWGDDHEMNSTSSVYSWSKYNK